MALLRGISLQIIISLLSSIPIIMMRHKTYILTGIMLYKMTVSFLVRLIYLSHVSRHKHVN